MSTPYYADESVTLWHGDALDVLRRMPSGSVDCAVTSPPYYGLRDYGTDGQQGLETTPAEYVAGMVGVFAEVRRVLADDGTLWLNIGDSYSQSGGHTDHGATSALQGRSVRMMQGVRNQIGDRPAKNLLGIPWRLAFSLQDDGWILRNAIVWHKPNAMPESVTDRLACRYEHVFLLSKARHYWFDLDPIRQPGLDRGPGPTWEARKAAGEPMRAGLNGMPAQHTGAGVGVHDNGRNPGDVWEVATQPFPDAHFAVMPVALAERCVQAGCKPAGTVLDPYSGSGTTGLAAARHGRRYVGIDLNAEYLDLSLRTRLAQSTLDFAASDGSVLPAEDGAT